MSGGVKVMAIHAQHLMRMGHTVCIVSPPPKKIPLYRKFLSWVRGRGWPDDSVRPMSHLDGSGIDHHVLDRQRPVADDDVPDGDVVIATWWETAEWVNALSANKGAKVYFIQHHEIFDYLPVARCHATYRMPLHKIVIARWLQNVMRSLYGDNVVDLVPNSIDRLQFFAPVRGKQSVPTIGFLYSIPSPKGLDVTLEVIQMVRERIPNLRVIAFGNGRPTPGFALPEGAEFFLLPPQDQIRNIYSQCDVWIATSRTEGFNRPAMEAMACRTPLVSTRAGWPEEAVKSGWNGVLVDVDDVTGLVQGVEWVLSRSDQDWRVLSSNAYQTTLSSSWEASAKQFEAALEHACRRSWRGEIAGKCTSLPRQ